MTINVIKPIKIVTFLVYAIIAYGNSYQTSNYKIIKNNNVTYSGPLKLNEIATLNLEDLEKQEIIISRIHSIDVDRNGNIFIGDDESRVIVLSPNFKFIRVIGNHGEGPGEFKNVSWIRISPNNELFVQDSKLKRISRFNSNGIFVSSFKYYGFSYNFEISDEFVYISNLAFLTKDGLVDKFTIEGEKLKSLIINDEESKIIHQSGNSGFIKTINNHKLLYSYPYPYKVLILDKNDVTKIEFSLNRKEFVGLTSNSKNVEGRFLGGDLPSRIKGVYNYLNEYIAVACQLKDKNVIDFFTMEGKYINSINLPEDHELMCIKNKLLYTVNRGFNNYPSIKVFELIKQ
ncbi:MAG: hypothetical protein GYA14_10200 [Ignavibacteria bacterium]|nr:hypothetical protein [Ignavibacteria bacterium]